MWHCINLSWKRILHRNVCVRVNECMYVSKGVSCLSWNTFIIIFSILTSIGNSFVTYKVYSFPLQNIVYYFFRVVLYIKEHSHVLFNIFCPLAIKVGWKKIICKNYPDKFSNIDFLRLAFYTIGSSWYLLNAIETLDN